MARLRPPGVPEVDGFTVQAELKDWDSLTWRDPAVFREWVVANLDQQPTGPQLELMVESPDYGARYRYAVDAWAVENGFGQERWPHLPDRNRLEKVGIQQMKSLERARRRLVV